MKVELRAVCDTMCISASVMKMNSWCRLKRLKGLIMFSFLSRQTLVFHFHSVLTVTFLRYSVFFSSPWSIMACIYCGWQGTHLKTAEYFIRQRPLNLLEHLNNNFYLVCRRAAYRSFLACFFFLLLTSYFICFCIQ